MKVLISACVMGKKVRWNGADKLQQDIIEWAKLNDIELIPICPEHELLGTPRSKIRLIQIADEVRAITKTRDIRELLDAKCKEIVDRHPDAVGFIGIANSPSCGISVGVKNLGKVIKGSMHKHVSFPSTESNALKHASNRDVFIRRLHENR